MSNIQQTKKLYQRKQFSAKNPTLVRGLFLQHTIYTTLGRPIILNRIKCTFSISIAVPNYLRLKHT